MHRTSAHTRDGKEPSLSDILEPEVQERYWISQQSIDRLLESEGARMYSRCACLGRAAFHWSGLEPASLSRIRVRKLTPLEQERAMGFPDNWTAGLSDSVRYLMTGNAVVTQVSEALAINIRKFLEEND